MRAVLLAAGYGTRLERDLRNDDSGQYTHLIGIPKPLLPIGHYPLISHWIHIFEKSSAITSIAVVVNDLHKAMYEKWTETLSTTIEIISDGSACNEDRSGAVACMQLGLQEKTEDTVFIAGDTLFRKDFSFDGIVAEFKMLQSKEKDACLILSAPVAEENVSKHGIIEVADSGMVTRFIEKPQPMETSSRLQCPCFYIMSSGSLCHLKDFLEEMRDKPLKARDATGMFIAELIHRVHVYAHHVSERYDVGGLQSYVHCHQDFLDGSKKE